MHCSIIEDCSQLFYFSKHTKEKGNDATACTKHEDVTEDWGRRKARYKNWVPPSLSRFPFCSSIQALWQFYLRAQRWNKNTRIQRAENMSSVLVSASLQTRRHDSFLSLHPLCFKICHRFLPFAVFKRPPNSRCVFVLCLFDPDGVTDSKILRKVWS